MKVTGVSPEVSVGIGQDEFKALVERRAQRLLGLAEYIVRSGKRETVRGRPLLGELLSQSIQIEELLDAYDAGNNCRWCWFRSLTAALKLFSDVGYELLHIEHALPAYRLLPIEGDFGKATEKVLGFTADVLIKSCGQLTERAHQLGLSMPSSGPSDADYAEELLQGRLVRDCRSIRAETAGETVTLLATAFLNLAAESADIREAGRALPETYEKYLGGSVTEDKLRSLELRFHNLQSLYDTKVSGTEVAELDRDLPVLRGHISVVFHLLRTATLFAHHFERHLDRRPCDREMRSEPPANREALVAALMNYSIGYIGQYIACATHLCQDMLRRYAEVGEVEVAVPPYRGFHVRPSTLISKLVLHYGSEVKMIIDGEEYDASSPLELFRANEKINAEKRRWLAAAIDELELPARCEETERDIGAIVYDVVLTLAGRNKLILYSQQLEFPAEPMRTTGTLMDKVSAEVTRLLTLGKIDLETDLKAKFVGDRRILAHIKLLADSGYGEDSFGNNVSLPDELAYLRR